MKDSDEQLAARIQQGDKDLFGILMERYEKKLFRYGRKFLSSQDNIVDMVQEVFIKAYQNIQSFDVTQKFSPWIYRIAHNTFINALKKTARSPLHFLDFDTLISHPIYEDPAIREQEEKQMSMMLEKGLDQLSPAYREIVVLFYLEELSYKEIAEVLRVPIGTVGIRLRRAKDALRKAYEKMGYKHEESI